MIVDFSRVRAGTEIVLLNLGPDGPFPGDMAAPADPATTGQVMQLHLTLGIAPAMTQCAGTPPLPIGAAAPPC